MPILLYGKIQHEAETKNSKNIIFFTDVIMSGAGAVVWAILLITWVITFQVQRVSWGPMGDTLSFIVPLGRA